MDNITITNEAMLEEALNRAQTMDDVMKIVHDMGLDMTPEELETFVAEEPYGELDENALDNVAGGWVGMMGIRSSRIMLRHAQARLRQTMFRVGYRSSRPIALYNYARRYLR